MENDKLNDKYQEITKEIQKEKMNWDFEDFLKKTKEEEKIIPLSKESKGGSISKFYWLAASLAILISLGIFYQNFSKNKIKEQDNLVKNQIIKQKEEFGKNNEIVAINSNDSLKIVSDSLVSDSTSAVDEKKSSDLMNQILPKRGRIKKDLRPRYAEISTPKKTQEQTYKSNYESNYVIINGQKIENEQEAIDLTKYSFRILSENMSKTVAQTDAINSFNNDY